jgi:hypothetical protein
MNNFEKYTNHTQLNLLFSFCIKSTHQLNTALSLIKILP